MVRQENWLFKPQSQRSLPNGEQSFLQRCLNAAIPAIPIRHRRPAVASFDKTAVPIGGTKP